MSAADAANGPAIGNEVASGQALGESYEAAGFAGRLGWGTSPALVVVDAVLAYADPTSPMYLDTSAAAVGVMAELIGAARAGGRAVVYTALAYRNDLADAGLFAVKVPALAAFVAGGPLGRWPDAIAPGADDWVVTKQYASGFFGTSLASGLTARGVDTVVVCGFSTSGCVRATALDALQSGFRPMVVSDGVADRDSFPHSANLFDLEAKYADVVTSREAAGRLRGAR